MYIYRYFCAKCKNTMDIDNKKNENNEMFYFLWQNTYWAKGIFKFQRHYRNISAGITQ